MPSQYADARCISRFWQLFVQDMISWPGTLSKSIRWHHLNIFLGCCCNCNCKCLHSPCILDIRSVFIQTNLIGMVCCNSSQYERILSMLLEVCTVYEHVSSGCCILPQVQVVIGHIPHMVSFLVIFRSEHSQEGHHNPNR